MIVELSENEPAFLHVRVIECLLGEWIVFFLFITIFNVNALVTIIIAVVFLFVLVAMLHVDIRISHICVFLVFVIDCVRSILVAILGSVLLIVRHSDTNVIFA